VSALLRSCNPARFPNRWLTSERYLRGVKGLVILLAATALVVGVAGARGQFPGRNGAIVISSNRSSLASGEVYSIRSDGTGRADLSRDPAADEDSSWSPDGSHIAFSREGTLIVADADGSGQLLLGPGVEPAWSPDGRRIAFVHDGAVWSAAPNGAGALQLAGGPSDHAPSWSPDGRTVAFTRDPNFLEVVPASGGSVLELARGANLGSRPFAWSRDSRSLVYANAYILYRVAADASTDQVLLRAPSVVGDLALSPDGDELAFSVEPPFSPQTRGAGIWMISLATGSARQLTHSGQQRDQLPTWSPDGSQIAFTRTSDVRIHIVSAHGAAARTLPREHPGTVFEALAWSPDGARLLFASAFTANYRLYSLAQIDSESLRQLTRGWAQNVDPAWSPDGSRIAFASNRSGHYEIYTMRANGSGLRLLTHDPADDRQPAWSPDGSRIVFTSNRLAGARERKAKKAGNKIAHLYVMRTDGSHRHRLTRGITDDEMPAWSPNGRTIAFALAADDPPILETIRADGSGLRRLGQTGASPDWSPNGKLLVFLHIYYPDGFRTSRASPPPQVELALMRPDGSFVSSLDDHPQARWSPDGLLLASADGSILERNGDLVATIPAGEASWQPLRRGSR
jgi:Tol biopolymer transport system component